MSYETLMVAKDGRVGSITLNRPDALNALNTKMVTELIEALTAFEKDEDTAKDNPKEQNLEILNGLF